MNERNLNIDALRAFGLLMVVLGHTVGVPSHIRVIIYSFHMPLFFILSGYLWTDMNIRKFSFSDFIKKKFKSLIIPYFKIGFICLFIWGVIYPLLFCNNYYYGDFASDIAKYVFGICYSIGTTEYVPHCSPIWFLTSLFCANMLFFMYRKLGIMMWLLPFIFMIGYFFTISKFPLPWNIGSGFIGSGFIWIGYLIQNIVLKLQ